MPFQDDRDGSQTNLVPMPGLNQSERFSGPLPAGENPSQQVPVPFAGRSQDLSTGQFSSFISPSTGQWPSTNLTRVLTTTLPRVSENTTSQRIPVVIKGSMKKPKAEKITRAAHTKRRMVVSLLGVLMLLMITGLALYSVGPLAHESGPGWNPLAQAPGGIYTNRDNGQLQLKVQATATAVYHKNTDGFGGGGGVQTVGNGAGSLNWPVGQCTYWANSRYHQLTGHWVSWSGNANQWVTGARAAGWNVSTSPHVPSIIVLMGVQGANTYYGHVAVVESIVAGASPVTVHTSNMNWYANGGGFDIKSYWDFTVGSGVYFVWHS